MSPASSITSRLRLVLPIATLLGISLHAALLYRSFLSVSHPINGDVMQYLGWMLGSRDGLRWFSGYDYLSGLGITQLWYPFVLDPFAAVMRIAPFGETFYIYKLSVVIFVLILTYVIGRSVDSPLTGQIAALGVTLFSFLPSRFFNMINVDFSGPGFMIMLLGWNAQILVAVIYLAQDQRWRIRVGFVLLTFWTLAATQIWQPAYLNLFALTFVVLGVATLLMHRSFLMLQKVLHLGVAFGTAVVLHAVVFGSSVQLAVFSARNTTPSVNVARELGFFQLISGLAGRSIATPVVLALAVVGVLSARRGDQPLRRMFAWFWATWTLALVVYSAVYAPLLRRGTEIGINPDYFMQISGPLNWTMAAAGISVLAHRVTARHSRLAVGLNAAPLLIALVIPLAWNIKNSSTRSETWWPQPARPPQVYSELSTAFAGYEIPDTARVLVVQDGVSPQTSFDDLFHDFADLRRTNRQGLFNLYSGFVRPWSAEFVSSFVFDGELRHSSITATKASPVAFELLGIDHVISREPIAIAGARRVAERPDGVGLYRLASGNRWFADAYEVKPNLAEHVAVLQAQETAAESWSGGRLRAVLYESIGQIVQPTTFKVRIEREKITVSGTTGGTSLLTLPIEFSTCNRWKSLSGDDARPVAVNGFFQGYVVSGEFAGEITRNTRGLGQVVCETRDYMRWRSINEEN